MLDLVDDLLEDGGGGFEGGSVACGERGDLAGEGADATFASGEQETLAGGGCGEQRDAGVVDAGGAGDEGLCGQGVDDARHGGRGDLLGAGEVAEGDGAGEDDDGESREAGGVEAGG